MEQRLWMILQLFGGAALFLYSMDTLTDALQQAAGDTLRQALARLTAHPLAGVLTGAAVTAAVQSSSAVTVLVLGLVGAGLLTLQRAVPVVFGANIGTTVTAQLLAFRLEDARYLLLAGLGMTLAVQSSSATIAVLQQVAARPGPDGGCLLGLAGAIPVLLGDNIGTTVTAVLASVGQSRDAKRLAAAHALFNLSGAAVCWLLLPQFTALVRLVSPHGPESAVLARQIANAHTLFNLGCTVLWLPLTPCMVRIVCILLPEKHAPLS